MRPLHTAALLPNAQSCRAYTCHASSKYCKQQKEGLTSPIKADAKPSMANLPANTSLRLVKAGSAGSTCPHNVAFNIFPIGRSYVYMGPVKITTPGNEVIFNVVREWAMSQAFGQSTGTRVVVDQQWLTAIASGEYILLIMKMSRQRCQALASAVQARTLQRWACRSHLLGFRVVSALLLLRPHTHGVKFALPTRVHAPVSLTTELIVI